MLGSARSVLLKYPGEPLPPNPMAIYNLNENTGTTAADSSGNNRTLTLTSATWAAGHTGSGLTNTTTGVGAKAVFTAPSAAITIMGWVQPLDLTAGTTHIAFGFIDNGNNTGCAIFTQRADFGTSNVLQGNIRIAGTLRALNASALAVGVWVHLAITYDGSTAILYKDGAPVASVSATGLIGQGDALCVAGGMVTEYDTDVVVDDIRVYSVALTPEQIVTGMNSPV
jgi:hypothetical protein